MATRLLLLAHAATAATRAASFPDGDEPLEPRAAAALVGRRLRYADRRFVSPALAARQTADRLALAASREPALADCDYGRWRGRALADVQAAEPEALAQWFREPDAAPHGGESIAQLCARVGAWLDGQVSQSGVALAITHASVVRAAILAAIGARPGGFRRIDVAPLSLAELSGHAGQWTFVGLGSLTDV